MRLSVLLTLPLCAGLTLSTVHTADARVVQAAQVGHRIERALLERGELHDEVDDQAVETRGGRVHSQHHGREVSLQLPGSAASSTRRGGSEVNVTSGKDFRTAVQETGEGSFRALLYLDNAQARREYAFDLGLDRHPTLLPDGGVLVRDNSGRLLGTIAPPWAIDAAEVPVATRYRLDGSAVTQVLDVTRSTRFPVVADPWWIPVLILARVMFGMMTKHAARQAAARGISQRLVRQVIDSGNATRGNGNTTIFTQGSGKKRIRVIVDNVSGNVITVTKG